MKKFVLFTLSAIIFGGITTQTVAQVYMAAGQENVKHINFQEVKSLKLNGVSDETVLFTKNALIPQKAPSATQNCGCDLSSPSYIAAMALNAEGNIVTMNMLGTQVYIALKDGRIQTINLESGNKSYNEQELFARMATTPDGSIYVLNNIGTQLVKITKDERVEYLGAIEGFSEIFAADAEKRASYGGDMISDTDGNLFVFTAFGYVIKVNPETLSAEYVGQISGLPEGYTVNGAAVTDDNAIVLASSQPKGIYFTDLNTLAASFAGENTTPTYDLASPNFLKTKQQSLLGNIALSLSPTLVGKERVFNINSNSNIKDAAIVLYSTDGRLVRRQASNLISGENKIDINGLISGIYLVNVVDASGNRLLTDKITVK